MGHTGARVPKSKHGPVRQYHDRARYLRPPAVIGPSHRKRLVGFTIGHPYNEED